MYGLNKILKYLLLLLFFAFAKKTEAQHLPEGFVYLNEVIPSIEVELRYAGNHNFIGKPIPGYIKQKPIITKQAAEALKKVQIELNKQNLGLKIYDAYRPQQSVDFFVDWAKNINDTLKKLEFYPNVKKELLFKEQYIAARSGHTRGSTVDLTIIDFYSEEKKELDMGSPYDFFGQQSWVTYENLTSNQLENRKLLQGVMKKYNFRNYEQEWWHFTLKDEPFPETYFNFTIE